MNKSLLALGAACIALTSMAAPVQKFQAPAKPVPVFNQEIKGLGNLQVAPGVASSMKKAPAKAVSAADVISSVEGEQNPLIITGSGYYLFRGVMLTDFQDQESPSHVIYGENNEVYVYDMIPNFPCDSYVKGTIDGDKVVFEFPQVVLWDEEYEDGYELTMFELGEVETEDGTSQTYLPLEGKQTLTFTVGEDGTWTTDELSDDVMLGAGLISEADGWVGYGATALSVAPFNDKMVEVPEDLTVVDNVWVSKGEGFGWPLNFAQGYDEIYFQGLDPNMPEAWIKATVEYDDYSATVSIAQNQYIGDYSGYYIFTKCAKIVPNEETGYDDYVLMPDDYEYKLTWDFDAETMTAVDKDIIFLTNASRTEIYHLSKMSNIQLVHQASFEGTPVNPEIIQFQNSMDSYGYDAFIFDVPALTEDGDVLLTDDLYYIVYVDGEQWTFDADEYFLDATYEEVPWGLSAYYIYNYGGCTREVDFFVEGISTLGVQSVYKYNGEETRSEIVTLDLEGDSVASIDADKKVANVKYFDVAGREVANPAAGVVIKRVVYEDGTVASFKKVVR